MAIVGVVIGSKSDTTLIQPALDMLGELGIEYEFSVISAHRTPEKARNYATEAYNNGIEVIIAGAGKAAHLPGVLASWSLIPVIGVPMVSGELGGMDALLSIVQMPTGIPVACVAINGAKNAAILAAQILALKNDKIKASVIDYRKKFME